jgi:hypothetical protein
MTIGIASSGKIPKTTRIGDPLCDPPLLAPPLAVRFSLSCPMAATFTPVSKSLTK